MLRGGEPPPAVAPARPRGGRNWVVLVVAVLAVVGGAVFLLTRESATDRDLKAASEAMEHRDFRGASTILAQVRDRRPDDPHVYLLLARAARRGGNVADAWRFLEQHAKLNGPEPERQRERQMLAAQGGNPEEGSRLLDAAFANPDWPDSDLLLEAAIPTRVAMLELAFNEGITLVEGPAGAERERAERAIGQWLRRRHEPENQAEGYVWRGRINRLTDRLAAAKDFRRAVELDPNNVNARLRLAEALAHPDPAEAVRQLEVLRDRDPSDAQVAVLLSDCLRSLGRPDDARKVLDKLLAIHPDHPAALVECGKAALDAGKPEEAEPFFRKALSIHPADAAAHLALSRCLHLTGREDEAKQHQQRYDQLESARVKAEAEAAERDREAWRQRVTGTGAPK